MYFISCFLFFFISNVFPCHLNFLPNVVFCGCHSSTSYGFVEPFAYIWALPWFPVNVLSRAQTDPQSRSLDSFPWPWCLHPERGNWPNEMINRTADILCLLPSTVAKAQKTRPGSWKQSACLGSSQGRCSAPGGDGRPHTLFFRGSDS